MYVCEGTPTQTHGMRCVLSPHVENHGGSKPCEQSTNIIQEHASDLSIGWWDNAVTKPSDQPDSSPKHEGYSAVAAE
jgi:hypothetical protein